MLFVRWTSSSGGEMSVPVVFTFLCFDVKLGIELVQIGHGIALVTTYNSIIYSTNQIYNHVET
jgi:hypothetical protein